MPKILVISWRSSGGSSEVGGSLGNPPLLKRSMYVGVESVQPASRAVEAAVAGPGSPRSARRLTYRGRGRPCSAGSPCVVVRGNTRVRVLWRIAPILIRHGHHLQYKILYYWVTRPETISKCLATLSMIGFTPPRARIWTDLRDAGISESVVPAIMHLYQNYEFKFSCDKGPQARLLYVFPLVKIFLYEAVKTVSGEVFMINCHLCSLLTNELLYIAYVTGKVWNQALYKMPSIDIVFF